MPHRELQKNMHANLIVLSPGPKAPQDYPHIIDFIKNLSERTAVYGVCLGMQMLVHSSGGKISTYAPPLHGKKSKLEVIDPLFNFLHDSEVARYHSLYCADYNSQQFSTVALAQDDKVPMWLKHNNKKWMGVQFHPESFMTEKAELHLKALGDWLAL